MRDGWLEEYREGGWEVEVVEVGGDMVGREVKVKGEGEMGGFYLIGQCTVM